MFVQSVRPAVPLPRSHFFLTVSRGDAIRTFAFRTHVVYVLALVIPLVGLGGVGAMLYLAFHDDLVASLMARQSQQQYAYEDRIDALRGELERQTRRQVSDQASVEGKMRDLILRESRLESRAVVMATLATQTGAVHGNSTAVSSDPVPRPKDTTAINALFGPRPGPLPDGLMSYAPAPPRAIKAFSPAKPHPEAEMVAPETDVPKTPGRVSMLDDQRVAVPTRLSLISSSLDDVERAQFDGLFRLGSRARAEAAHLREALGEAGLSLDRFKASSATATGGPFVPLDDEKGTPFGHALSDLRDTLASAIHLRSVVARVPLVAPLPGVPEVTSPFGARVDPFLGRPAMHTGVDLRESYGADVESTAAGRVAFAGPAGGYGNMVEIDHGNGLSTRYAHLSEIEVAEGQTLGKGSVIGRVGTTGRSTGPHLHYEVRIDGEPVDPIRFLNAGMHLAQAETH